MPKHVETCLDMLRTVASCCWLHCHHSTPVVDCQRKVSLVSYCGVVLQRCGVCAGRGRV